MKKQPLCRKRSIRMTDELFNKISFVAEKTDRSFNYVVCKSAECWLTKQDGRSADRWPIEREIEGKRAHGK